MWLFQTITWSGSRYLKVENPYVWHQSWEDMRFQLNFWTFHPLVMALPPFLDGGGKSAPSGPYRTKNAGTNRALTCDKHMFLSKAFKQEHLLSGIVIIDLRDCHIHCKTKHNVLSRCSNFTCGKPSTKKRFDEIDSFKVTPPLLTTCNETLI